MTVNSLPVRTDTPVRTPAPKAPRTGRRLLRLQCYEGQDETKALYEWDYGKQLLYTQILREKISQLVDDAADITEAVERIGKQESVFFSDRFLAPRPLLEAVRSEQPVVLLVDEIDRADEALEAVLLELLGEYQVSVPEIGTFTASANSAALSSASRRTCIGVVPAWASCPLTVTSYQRMACTPVTTPMSLSSASRIGPCSMCSSKKAESG